MSINIVGMSKWEPNGILDESAFTPAPADLQDVDVCRAVTSIDIYYDVRRAFYEDPIVGKKVPPVWIVGILSKLPSVTSVNWEFYDFLNVNPEKRVRFHSGMCPPSVRCFVV